LFLRNALVGPRAAVVVALCTIVSPAARAQDAPAAANQPAGATLAALGLTATPARPFGTLREQAALQQRWLARRLNDVLPALLRKHDVDAWVVPMREYNEDPVFSSLVSPETFAARRRTIYAFFDRCVRDRTVAGTPASACRTERLALGGTSQGGLYEAVRATKPAPTGGTAELWGDEQWQVLAGVLRERAPRRIAVDVSRTFAFSDGLSAGELEGMQAALGAEWASRFVRVDALPLELIATRLPEEDAVYREMNRLVWQIIDEAFSNRVVKPGVTRTSDVVWWMRQRVNDLGLGTWFQPSVEVQRRGWTAERLGEDPVIVRGDVLHCDFGITGLRLNTDTQHMGYVLRDGETDVPAGLRAALRYSNRLQDILVAEIRPGRTGNEVLRAAQSRMKAAGIDGTIYTHPIGMHGHGAGPLIGLWDYQDGVPGRGDASIIPRMWFSIELQATTPVPEWDGQRVRSAQEEDIVVGADGVGRWAYQRQTAFHLVR
jgi:Xaa-Pro aminopeptidase